MGHQTEAKRERVVESVRRGFEGDAAVEFVRQSGFALSVAGLARHLRALGGRERVLKLVDRGFSNEEIMEGSMSQRDPRSQQFAARKLNKIDAISRPAHERRISDDALFPTKRLSINVPTELYEAIRLAARTEGKTQSQLISELLIAALSRMSPELEDDT